MFIVPLGSEKWEDGVPYVSLGIVGLCFILVFWPWFFLMLQGGRAFPGYYHAYFPDLACRSDVLFRVSPLSLAGLKAYFSLISGAFLHAGWLHFFSNMLIFFGFGAQMEKRLGHLRFALFYLGATALTSLLTILFYALASPRPAVMIGASGAVSAVMGAYMVKFPHERIRTLVWVLIRIWVMRLSARLIVGYFILLNLFMLWYRGRSSVVSYICHVLGFAIGILVIWLLTGTKVESKASQRKGEWKRSLKSIGSMLGTEGKLILLTFVLIPLVTFFSVYGMTYLIRTKYHWLLYRRGDTFSTRSRLSFLLMLDYFPIVLLVVGAVAGGFYWWWRQRKLRTALDEEERCMWCRQTTLSTHEDGVHTTCKSCGFDSERAEREVPAGVLEMFRQSQTTMNFLRDAHTLVQRNEQHSAMFSIDDEQLKDTFGSFSEAYDVFRDFVQRHEEMLLQRLELDALNTPPPTSQDPEKDEESAESEGAKNATAPPDIAPADPRREMSLLDRLTKHKLSVDLSASDGEGSYLREQQKMLEDARQFIEFTQKKLREEIAPLLDLEASQDPQKQQ